MITESFKLTNENIDKYVALVRQTGEKKNAERKMLTGACLTLEEILLNYQSAFGVDQEVKLKIKTRFNQLSLALDLLGKAYNPINSEEESNGVLIINELDMRPRYSYSAGNNHITISLIIDQGKKELIGVCASVVIGLLIGYICKLLPANIVELCQITVGTISSAIFGLMKMATMPVIFLCVLYGILGSGSINSFKENGLRIVGRLFLSVFIMLLVLLLISIPIFSIHFVSDGSGSSSFTAIVETLFSIIPDNIFSPFLNGDNIKIIMLGVIFGCALLVIGEKANMVVDLCFQLKEVCSLIMVWVGKLIPILIVVVLVDLVLSGSISSDMLALAQIVIVYVIYVAIILVVTIFRVAKKRNMTFKDVASSVLIPGMKALASASSMFCYSDMEEGLSKKLKISDHAISFGLPIGIAFYQPIAIMYGIFVLYFAGSSNMGIDIGWIISFLLICFITAIAAPPVSGGSVALLAIIFTSLSISDPRIVLAYPLFMLMDYPNTSFRVMMLMLEIAKNND